ncbi:MAG: SpoIID/LytB domain-containing protein [Lachnospiraceae bacterium]|nr:SpoIID/LytB domain-containing protein [Lachnospiraceae bacterium]
MRQRREERRERTKQLRCNVYLFLFGLLFFFFATGECKGFAAGVSTVQEIRVGLKSNYANKQSITLYNKSLELGYCNGREYFGILRLQSETGIKVTPERGQFFAAEGSFSLQKAEEAVARLKEAGAIAYTVLFSEERAGIYLPVDGNGTTAGNAYALCDAIGKKCGIIIDRNAKSRVHLLRIDTGETVLLADGEGGDYPQFAATEQNENGMFAVDLGTNRYRGRIEIGRYGGKATVTAVNVVLLEEYLYGVVPCEMPASWQMEALKAQAVCARSYALMKAGYHAETDIRRGFRMVDTVQSQVYGGISREHIRSNAAVDATKGKTLCYENRTVAGYYFAASGGHTENVEDVWGVTIPYLQGVPDTYEINPSVKPWEVTIKTEELERLLQAEEKSVGDITKVLQEVTTSSGRVYSLRIIGRLGNVGLPTDALRNVLDFSGTKFRVLEPGTVPDKVTVQGASGTKETAIHDCYVISGDGQVQSAEGLTDQYVVLSEDNLTNYPRYAPEAGEYLFAGMGSGHGVGMSQSGANGMAGKGYTYTEILEHYFTGISVR